MLRARALAIAPTRAAGLLVVMTVLAVLAAAAPAAASSYERGWAVSCSAPDACTAVGDSFTSSNMQASLAMRWDGTAWAVQPFPAIPDAADDALTSVACPTATSCFATGWSHPSAGGGQTAFIAHWTADAPGEAGDWSLQPLPPIPSDSETWLTSISCSSADACTAVGSLDSHNPNTATTLAYRWDGLAWSLDPPANPSGADISRLWDVSCASASFCVAVGMDTATPSTETLLETWDGSSWSIGSAATPDGTSAYGLGAVSCTAADACTAVGGFLDARGWPRTLAERWDGSTWTVQEIPSVEAQNSLNDVSCSSATACVAVGEGADTTQSLVEQWDGDAWTIATITPDSGWAPLEGVSCPSPSDCMAAGWAVFDDGHAQVVTELLRDGTWSAGPPIAGPPASDPPPPARPGDPPSDPVPPLPLPTRPGDPPSDPPLPTTTDSPTGPLPVGPLPTTVPPPQSLPGGPVVAPQPQDRSPGRRAHHRHARRGHGARAARARARARSHHR